MCQFPAGSELRESPPQHPAEATDFMQQPVGFIPDDKTSHIISTLNWISPTMEFDLSQFNYTTIGTGDQFRDPINDPNVPTHQNPSVAVDNVQSHVTPTSFPDSNDAETPGTAYVDNRGARRPRNGRYADRILDEASPSTATRNCQDVPMIVPEPHGFSFVVPSLPDLYPQENAGSRVLPFTLDQYHTMCQAYQDCCLTSNSADRGAPFFPTQLPSVVSFTTLLVSYRRHFDPKVLPLVHPSDANNEEPHRSVVKLAMSGIGSQYLDTEYTELAVALHEFLRRVLTQRGSIFLNATAGHLTAELVALGQAKLLNYMGIAYCGSKRVEGHRLSALDLVEYKALYKTQHTILQGDVAFQDHQNWILIESARRLYHGIWLLEVMSRHHFDTRANLLLDFSDVVLPCKEDTWRGEANQTQVPANPPTLEKALRVLYVEKRLLKDVGHFSRVLIIHGLYCQTWDVAKSLNRPLLRWTPSAHKGNAESHELTVPLWPPSIPLYNHWRNATCDCLDVLPECQIYPLSTPSTLVG